MALWDRPGSFSLAVRRRSGDLRSTGSRTANGPEKQHQAPARWQAAAHDAVPAALTARNGNWASAGTRRHVGVRPSPSDDDSWDVASIATPGSADQRRFAFPALVSDFASPGTSRLHRLAGHCRRPPKKRLELLIFPPCTASNPRRPGVAASRWLCLHSGSKPTHHPAVPAPLAADATPAVQRNGSAPFSSGLPHSPECSSLCAVMCASLCGRELKRMRNQAPTEPLNRSTRPAFFFFFFF